MRISFTTQQAAQTRADEIFSAGQAVGKWEPLTTRWAIPYQDLDANGQPIGTNWYVNVNDRCRPFLTDAEVTEAGFPVSTMP